MYRALYSTYKSALVSGRYITNENLHPFLETLISNSKESVLGHSVLGKPIYLVEVGSGKTKVLIWSQMHGNESTTTKAMIDFIKFLTANNSVAEDFRKHFTFKIIPILNPDGAEAYTRENANEVDLNRDFLNLSQPESHLLMNLFSRFNPDFCYNMHDQRTIFSVGDTGKPATISFLSPAFNDSRDLNEVRECAMGVIADMNTILQEFIPGQVGRFDDSYNRNCVGDTFQNLGVSTILFEAGHYSNDYQREVSREVVFLSLIAACESIINKSFLDDRISLYMNIPQNKTLFYDFVYKNVKINYDSNEICSIFAAQYREVLQQGSIVLIAYISDVNISEKITGHIEYENDFDSFSDDFGNFPVVGRLANFRIGGKSYVNGRLVQ